MRGRVQYTEIEILWKALEEGKAVETVHIIVIYTNGSLTSNEMAGVGGRRDG